MKLERAFTNALTGVNNERFRATPSATFDFVNQQYYIQKNEFSRNSEAYYTDWEGYLNKATINEHRYTYDALGNRTGDLLEDEATNLLIRATLFDDAAWTKTTSSVVANDTESPNRIVNADKYVPNNATANFVIKQDMISTIGVTYTYSMFVKAAEYDTCTLLVLDSNASNPAVRFDLTAETATYGSGEVVSFDIESFANGWYRCSLTWTAFADETVEIRFYDRIPGSRTSDGTSGIYIWGAQVEVGNTATSFIESIGAQVTREADVGVCPPTPFLEEKTFADIFTFTRTTPGTYWDENGNLQTAPADAIRFDHDPITGEPLGYLAEETRTNLVPFSEVNTTNWGGVGSPTRTDLSVNRWGMFPGLLVQSSGASWHATNLTIGSVTSGQPYAVTFYVEEDTSGAVALVMREVSGGVQSTISGTFGSISTGDQTAGTIENVTETLTPSGATIVTAIWTPNFTGDMQLRIGPFSATVDEGVIAYAAQVEEGEYNTSYIPTSGSTEFRQRDRLDVLDIRQWFNHNKGTAFIECSTDYGTSWPFEFSNIAATMRIFFRDAGDNGMQCIVDQGSTQTGIGSNNAVTKGDGSMGKYAISYDNNKPTHMSINHISATANLPTMFDDRFEELYIAHDGSSNYQTKRHVKLFKYWNVALPLTSIESLTNE